MLLSMFFCQFLFPADSETGVPRSTPAVVNVSLEAGTGIPDLRFTMLKQLSDWKNSLIPPLKELKAHSSLNVTQQQYFNQTRGLLACIAQVHTELTKASDLLSDSLKESLIELSPKVKHLTHPNNWQSWEDKASIETDKILDDFETLFNVLRLECCRLDTKNSAQPKVLECIRDFRRQSAHKKELEFYSVWEKILSSDLKSATTFETAMNGLWYILLNPLFPVIASIPLVALIYTTVSHLMYDHSPAEAINGFMSFHNFVMSSCYQLCMRLFYQTPFNVRTPSPVTNVSHVNASNLFNASDPSEISAPPLQHVVQRSFDTFGMSFLQLFAAALASAPDFGLRALMFEPYGRNGTCSSLQNKVNENLTNFYRATMRNLSSSPFNPFSCVFSWLINGSHTTPSCNEDAFAAFCPEVCVDGFDAFPGSVPGDMKLKFASSHYGCGDYHRFGPQPNASTQPETPTNELTATRPELETDSETEPYTGSDSLSASPTEKTFELTVTRSKLETETDSGTEPYTGSDSLSASPTEKTFELTATRPEPETDSGTEPYTGSDSFSASPTEKTFELTVTRPPETDSGTEPYTGSGSFSASSTQTTSLSPAVKNYTSIAYWTDFAGSLYAGYINRTSRTLNNTILLNTTSLANLAGVYADILNNTLYWVDYDSSGSSGGGIYSGELDPFNPTTLKNVKALTINHGKHPYTIFMDRKNNKGYWSAWSLGSDDHLFSAAIDPQNQAIVTANQTILNNILIYGVSVDNVNNKIYWIQGSTGRIYVGNISPQNPTAITSSTQITSTSSTFGLSIDYKRRKIYWRQGSSPTSIYEGDLNLEAPAAPTNVKVIATDTNHLMGSQGGLYIVNQDDATESSSEQKALRIFWAQFQTATIGFANITGSTLGNQTILFTGNNTVSKKPSGIHLSNGRLYWGDYNGGGLYTADSINPDNPTTLQNVRKIINSGQIYGLFIEEFYKKIYYSGWAYPLSVGDFDPKIPSVAPTNTTVLNSLYTSGIAVDRLNSKIYWIDWGTRCIFVGDINPQNPTGIINSRQITTTSVANFLFNFAHSQIYWRTPGASSEIYMGTMNLTSPNAPTDASLVISDSNNLMGNEGGFFIVND